MRAGRVMMASTTTSATRRMGVIARIRARR
jgi:hypothetical protein